MPGEKGAGHVVENFLLLVLAFFLPPCAVACVTGCGSSFALNLFFTFFFTYIGGVVHAICIVVIYGFREEEMPRVRRQARLRTKQQELYREAPLLPPRYDTRPARATGSQDKTRAENGYVAGHAHSGSAFAQDSVNAARGVDYDLDIYPPPAEADPGSTA